MRNILNKVNVSPSVITRIRKMYFYKKPIALILKQSGVSASILYKITRGRNWLKKRERYYMYLCYKSYSMGISIYKLSKKIGIDVGILYRAKRRNNIDTKRFAPPNKRINHKMKIEFIKEYNAGFTAKEIGNKYGFKTSKTVLDVLCERGIPRRPSTKRTYYNERCFENVDSHDKAYILGLFLADGYVIKDYCGVAIGLTIGDKYLLESVAKIFGESTCVSEIKCSGKKVFKINGVARTFNRKNMARLNVHNKKIAIDMKKYGIVKSKSKILKMPSVNNRYHSSLCRGIWDGDGTVGIAKTNNIWCKFVTASRKFAYGFVNKIVAPCSFKVYSPLKNNSLYKIRVIGGNESTKRFLRWIYKDKGDLYLRRKYEKVQDQIC